MDMLSCRLAAAVKDQLTLKAITPPAAWYGDSAYGMVNCARACRQRAPPGRNVP